MKIVFVNHYGVTYGETGPTRNFEFAKVFSDMGHDVEFWTCGYNHYTGQYHQSIKKKITSLTYEHGVKVRRFWSIKYRKSFLLRGLNILVFSILTALYALFTSRKDYYVVTSPPLTLALLIVCKIKRQSFVLDVEDLWPDFLIELGLKNRLVITIMRFYERILYKYSDLITAVSEGMRKHVLSYEERKDVLLVPLGVHISRYKNFQENSIQYEWERNNFIVMYCGAHNPANSLETLVELAPLLEEYRDIKIVLVGDGASKSRLKELIGEKGITNIILEDPVPSHQVPNILSKADICVTLLKDLPSFRKVRPNKIFEYMAASKPIICGIKGEASDIIIESKSGFVVDINNLNHFKDKILFFYNNRDEIIKAGNNGFKYISEHGDRIKIIQFFESQLNERLRNK